ncbi:MAG: hypothetical protein NT175_03460 [Bacteroidetes bacterium]|nr:hypothetical protein [Bacteroidota bacterium]
MKEKILLIVITLGIVWYAFSQKPAIELAFTAIDSTSYVQLDSIKVMNRTHGVDTVLYYPDTVLTLYYVGIHDNQDIKSNFRIMQNFPNPVVDQTTISIYVPERDEVSLMVTDVLGRHLITSERLLDKGYRSFKFKPGSRELYFFTASWRGINQYIKILSAGNGSDMDCKLEYLGCDGHTVTPLKSISTNRNFLFSIGDTLLYIGYMDTLQSGLLDAPETSEDYTFQFATDIPCPETPTVDYAGQVYNTIQIFSQCWLKENLNVGIMIPGTKEMTDNGIIEKYCFDNIEDSCLIYGGYYQWQELMQYITQQGTQGICPPNWHIPTEEEWKVLEGAADSYYGIGDPEWDIDWNYRGYDAGTNLKSTISWFEPNSGTDLTGFSGFAVGSRSLDGSFPWVGYECYWWTSTKGFLDFARYRYLHCYASGVDCGDYYFQYGLSVRCIRDY